MIANRRSIDVIAILAASVMTWSGAAAFDETKYPDWSGQWGRTRGVGVQWDETKPPGLKQEAPLTAEYQKVHADSMADQAQGGQGKFVGKEEYYVSGDGYLMPTRRDQAPPNLKYFGRRP